MRFIERREDVKIEYLLRDYQTRHNCDLSYAESKITASRFSTSRLSLPDCFLCRFFTTYLEQPYGLFPGRPIAQAVSIPHSPCVHCPPGVRFLAGKWFPASASLYQVFAFELYTIRTVKFLPNHRSYNPVAISGWNPLTPVVKVQTSLCRLRCSPRYL